MPGRRPLAALMLVALLCACAPAPPRSAEGGRAAPPSRGARAEASVPRASPADVAATAADPGRAPSDPIGAPTGADAIVSLRQRLRARGFGPEVTAGPMVAVWSDSPPPARLAAENAVPRAVRRAVSAPTWLVLTEDGAWWVWEHDDLGPVAYAPSSRP
jgi:hypothetical protein